MMSLYLLPGIFSIARSAASRSSLKSQMNMFATQPMEQTFGSIHVMAVTACSFNTFLALSAAAGMHLFSVYIFDTKLCNL